MKNTLTAIASIAALTSFGTYAQSSDYPMDDSGFYVGGNYGYLKAEGEDDFDDDKDVWQGLLGYKFNEWVALEGSYIDFGDYGSDLAGAETDGYTAAVKGSFLFQTVFLSTQKWGNSGLKQSTTSVLLLATTTTRACLLGLVSVMKSHVISSLMQSTRCTTRR